MGSYLATITCSGIVSAPHSLLTPKGFKFYSNINIKCYFAKIETHFSQNTLFTDCDIVLIVMVNLLHLIKHVSLGF